MISDSSISPGSILVIDLDLQMDNKKEGHDERASVLHVFMHGVEHAFTSGLRASEGVPSCKATFHSAGNQVKRAISEPMQFDCAALMTNADV